MRYGNDIDKLRCCSKSKETTEKYEVFKRKEKKKRKNKKKV